MKKFLARILCCFIPSRRVRHIVRSKFYKEEKPDFSWVGRHSYLGLNCVRMHKDTTVGAFCSIAWNVSLGPSQHPIDWLSTSPFQYADFKKLTPNQKLYKYSIKPVVVGNDVWIGNNVTIQDGVKIADGCIIGSNAVVTHDTPPYAILAGVPARVIRYRFPPEIIAELENLKWWDLPDEIIATLPFNDIHKCIEKLHQIRKKIK